MNRKINNEKIMISICPVSNIKKTCKNSPKISFKGVQPQEPLGVYDYVVYRQAKSDAKKILDSKRDVIRISKIENQRAQSIINSQIKKVQFAIEQTPERIKCRDGKTYMVDSFTGRLSHVTYFKQADDGIKIDRIDVVNSDSTKDVIIADENNKVRNIHKNFRQIAPNSFIEDCGYQFKDGVLKSRNGALSYVNDGNARERVDTRENVYRFSDGQLISFYPKTSCAGKDFSATRIYKFSDEKLVRYAEDYTKSESGEVDFSKNYQYSDYNIFI